MPRTATLPHPLPIDPCRNAPRIVLGKFAFCFMNTKCAVLPKFHYFVTCRKTIVCTEFCRANVILGIAGNLRRRIDATILPQIRPNSPTRDVAPSEGFANLVAAEQKESVVIRHQQVSLRPKQVLPVIGLNTHVHKTFVLGKRRQGCNGAQRRNHCNTFYLREKT